jgi:hypothetical protein
MPNEDGALMMPLKRRQTSTRLHDVTTQKTAIFKLPAVRTSKPTYMPSNFRLQRFAVWCSVIYSESRQYGVCLC